MRLPPSISEHPIESVLAGLLLMALLFVSAGSGPVPASESAPKAALNEKL